MKKKKKGNEMDISCESGIHCEPDLPLVRVICSGDRGKQ